jgi:hypothetical protein
VNHTAAFFLPRGPARHPSHDPKANRIPEVIAMTVRIRIVSYIVWMSTAIAVPWAVIIALFKLI